VSIVVTTPAHIPVAPGAKFNFSFAIFIILSSSTTSTARFWAGFFKTAFVKPLGRKRYPSSSFHRRSST
jgi:hypothetical protein